jgi:hypothetical protein
VFISENWNNDLVAICENWNNGLVFICNTQSFYQHNSRHQQTPKLTLKKLQTGDKLVYSPICRLSQNGQALRGYVPLVESRRTESEVVRRSVV